MFVALVVDGMDLQMLSIAFHIVLMNELDISGVMGGALRIAGLRAQQTNTECEITHEQSPLCDPTR